MKKNHEPNPVFRLVSVIPALVRERGCECLEPQEACSGHCTGGSSSRTVQPEKPLAQAPLLQPRIQELPQTAGI